MTPIHTPATTNILGAPQGWDAEKNGPCAGLPIVRSDGVSYSYWSLSWRERLTVLCGKPVRLAVASSAHPPVNLDTNT